MSIKNIAVIGIGELGSRHLQSLYKSNIALNLFAIDPNKDSLQLGKERISDLEANQNIRSLIFSNSIDDLPAFLDLAVIATNSDVRLAVIKDLLSSRGTQNMILEKVLFQNEADLDICHQLLRSNQTQAWVNCPRRLWKDYISIKDELQGQKGVNYNLKGINWGLGCNSIHFLDLFSWLTNSKLISIDNSQLGDQLLEAKRDGYIEFSGTLRATFENNNTMSLTSDISDSKPNFIIEISGKNFSYVIEEAQSKYIFKKLSDGKILSSNEKKMSIPFQSDLTQKIAEDMLTKGMEHLTPYTDSSQQHKLLIASLICHIGKIMGEKVENCAIT